MKAEAYTCDYCNELKYEAECVGISLQEDMFDKLKSFPVVYRCDKAQAHLCSSCYNLNVVSVAERETNRRYNERAYELKLNEMSYLVRSQCVTNYNKKVHKILAQNKK